MKTRILFIALIIVLAVTTFLPPAPAQAAGTYKCQLVAQTPKDWTVMKPYNDFDASWTLLNTGTANWNGVDLVYLGGTRMHKYYNRYDVTKVIKPYGKLVVTLDMVAPKTPGTYVTYWGLQTGKTTFCKFYLIVTVK